MANTSSIQKLLILSVALVLGALVHVPSSQAATYTVANTNDAGAGSLRQAIIDANGNVGVIDTIDFSVSGTVNLASDLPGFTEAVVVDGRTAPNNLGGADFILGAAGRTYCLQFNAGAGNVVRGIACQGGSQQGFVFQSGVTGATVGGTDVRDGNEIQATTGAGIQISGADNVTIINTKIGTGTGCFKGITVNGGGGTVTNLIIGGSGVNERNVIVNSTQHGIDILDASGVIKGNYIGTDGNNDNGNGQAGITVGSGNTNLTIGGVNAGEGNVISGNNWGGVMITLSGGVTIQGNYIGTNAAGTAAIANSQMGISVQTSNNTIGGNTAGARNIISGNTQAGILIDPLGGNITGNTIKGNYIGLNTNGNGALANGQAGITIQNGTITNTAIGGVNAGEGNVISGNTGAGIAINNTGTTGTTIYGNTIGLQVDKTTSQANGQAGIATSGDNTTIGQANVAGSRNIISSNGGIGVYIKGADNTTVVNNYIGMAGDGVTQKTNVNHGIAIDTTGSANTIGGTAAGAQNIMAAANLKNCVNVDTSAGNFNKIRQNNCLGGGNILITNPANESIATPTVTTANTSYASGTSVANGIVDLFSNGVFFATVNADGTGAWEKSASFTLNQKLTASVTNGTNSTSSTTSGTTIDQDSTSPTTPTVTSHTNNSYVATATIDLTGTKEVNSSIWIDGVQQVANDKLTTWSIAGFALVEGQNNLSVVAKDFSSNSSAAAAITIHRDTTVPAAPTLSYPSTAGANATITGSGTEVNGLVKVNGIGSNVYVDGLGNFSVFVSLQPGVNSVSITVVDAAGNTSPASIATITNSAGGGSSGGSSGGSNSPVSGPDEEPVVNDDEEPEGMAGEEEPDPVVEPDTDVPDVVEPDVVTVPDVDQPNVKEPEVAQPNVDEPEDKTEEDSGSFYSGIYEYVQPIKQVSIRDRFTSVNILSPKYKPALFNNKLFGNKNAQGVPQFLIELKTGEKELPPTRDSDGDGAYDWEEIMGGSNINVVDTDADGYTDAEELFIYGTDPQDYDSDGDGISDLVDLDPNYNKPEVSAQELVDYIAEEGITESLGEIDSDEDGLNDSTEFNYGTDPQDDDSDADGISDGDEILFYGTDPNTTSPSSAAEGISIVNAVNGDTIGNGEVLLMGHVSEEESTVQAYEVSSNGDLTWVGETTSDENGLYVLLTETELDAGEHTLILIVGDSLDELTDISQTLTLNVVDYIKKPEYVSLGLVDGSTISEKRPTLALTAADNYMIVIAWQSTIYGQTLIADASNQTVNASPVENLELGEHTVTWYAMDPETGAKSQPTQISFEVTPTAFVSGETSSPWLIVLGSIAVLASLTALALFYRNRKIEA